MPAPKDYDLTNPESVRRMFRECPALKELAESRANVILSLINNKHDTWPSPRYVYNTDHLKFAIVQAYTTGFVDATQTANEK